MTYSVTIINSGMNGSGAIDAVIMHGLEDVVETVSEKSIIK